MAQFINITEPELQKFPPWRAHTWRQISRELAGIRGCAPAIHFHDTTHDLNTDLLAPDDRIFKWHTGEQIHFWGMEMWAGGMDTLNVYFRPLGGTDSDWILVKGTGLTGNTAYTEFHPNKYLRNWGNDPINNNPFYNAPSSGTASLGSEYYSTTPSDFPYLIEDESTGNLNRTMYGPGTTSNDNTRFCEIVLKEPTNPTSKFALKTKVRQQYKYNGDNITVEGTVDSIVTESTSPNTYKIIVSWKSVPENFVKTKFVSASDIANSVLYAQNGSKEPNKLFAFVDPSIEYTIHSMEISDLDAYYITSAFNNIRCFTFMREGQYKLEINETGDWNSPGTLNGKTLQANTFEENKHWYTTNTSVNNSTAISKFNPIDYSTNPGLYGTLPEQLWNFTDNLQTYRSRFTKTLLVEIRHRNVDLVTDTVFAPPTVITLNPGTITTTSVITQPYQKVIGYGAVFEYIPSGNFINAAASGFDGVTTPSQRFGKTLQRWNGTGQTLINRRHLVVEGLTIRPSANRNVNQDTNLFGFISASNTILDLRGSVFRNCTFEDMNFNGQSDTICLSGCKFVNCKFKRCTINMHADSVMFMYCDFEGRADSTDSFNVSGISCAYIGCVFEHNFRTFFFGTDRSPCTDNLWLKCNFDTTLFNSGGSEQFLVEQVESRFINTPIDPTHPIPLLAKQKMREFSRNMFISNRVFDSSIFNISVYTAFARANLYFLNDIHCPTEINNTTLNASTSESTTELSGGAYYDVHFWNHYSKFALRLGENTHHLRFVSNVITEPHLWGSRWSSENGAWNATSQFSYPIFSIQSREDPAGGFWDCKHTSRATGNKLINNRIQNWAGMFSKTATSPCSIYLNFYNIELCSKCFDSEFNKDLHNKMLDWLDNADFNSDGTADGKFINVAYKNSLSRPTPYSNRTKVGGTTTVTPCVGFGDNAGSIGTFGHITFPGGVCKETTNYFNCNAVYIGSGTNYPNPYTGTFGIHGKQGNDDYRRISVPTFTSISSPVTITASTAFTGDLFNRIDTF